jgi:hypothetical protein
MHLILSLLNLEIPHIGQANLVISKYWTLVFNFPPIALEGTKALCTGKQIVSKGWDKAGLFSTYHENQLANFRWENCLLITQGRKACNLSFFQGWVMIECNCEMRRSKVE